MDAESFAGSLGLEVAAWLVTYALHSTVLLLAALAAFAWIGRAARTSPRVADAAPAWRECIGKVALLAGIVTASLQAALGIEPFGLRPALVESVDAPLVAAAATVSAPHTVHTVRTVQPVQTMHPVHADEGTAIPTDASNARASIPIYLTSIPIDFAPVIGALLHTTESEVDAAPAQGSFTLPVTHTDGPIAAPAADSNPRVRWVTAFLALWAIVAAAAAARRVAGWRALQRSLVDAEPASDPDALARFEALRARIAGGATGRGRPTLRVAPLLASPLTRGILRPEVCIPPRALRDLEADELDALLGHELAHVARRDPMWLVVFRALEVVFCLQPLNRIVARQLEEDAEWLCDDRAVVWTGERLPLASCLTEVASWLVPEDGSPRLAVGMAAHGARLTRRVERLVDDSHSPDSGVRRTASTLAAVLFAGTAIAVVPGFAAQRSVQTFPEPRIEFVPDGQPTIAEDSESALGATATQPAEPMRDDATPLEPADIDVTDDCESACPTDEAPTHVGVRRVAVPDVAPPLGDVLHELDVELARMRSELARREGGAALIGDVESLAGRIEQLRARAAGVSALLATRTNILLSPEEAGRTAEEQ